MSMTQGTNGAKSSESKSSDEAPSRPQSSQGSSASSSGSSRHVKCIGRYVLTGCTLGKGNFARVEAAVHTLTRAKVSRLWKLQMSCFDFFNATIIKNLFNI